MADQIEVTSLASQAASSIDSDTQVVAFTQAGDTTRLPFIEAVDAARAASACVCIQEAKLTIPTAEVLTLNSIPIEIVPAPSVGYAIQILSASMRLVYNSAAYATNTVVVLTTVGAGTEEQFEFASGALTSTVDTFTIATNSANQSEQIIENAAVQVEIANGDPTAGNSDIDIYITYRTIQL